MYDLKIIGSTVLHSQSSELSSELTDIGIKDGKITFIGDLQSAPATQTIDGKGLHTLPGIIDSQVHFREPGAEHKEDLESGTRGAVMGGVTTVFEMPNTKPSTTTEEAFRDKLQRAKDRCHSNYAFFIGAAPENLEKLAELETLPGCCGVKVFMGSSTGSLLIEDDELLFRSLKSGRRRVAIHSEDEARLRERRSIVEKSCSVFDHPVWRDEKTALYATQRLLAAAEKTGRPIHVLHVTTGEEMQLLAKTKQAGIINCTVECTPQHLTLHAPECYERLGTYAQMNPPIRNKEHQEALWMALQAGVVDVLGSDHAPHTVEEKTKTYPDSPSGMTGVQTIVPIMLNHINAGKLSLSQFVKMMTSKPAEIYGLKNKGHLKTGFDADITIVDLKKTQTVSNQWIVSKSQWTPYDGMTVTGWPMATIVGGHVVMQEGELLAPHRGQACDFEF